jgi:phosphoribosylanthranilate isomerase
MELLVKICGLTRPEDAAAAIAAGADLVGFVFVPGTPRAVDVNELDWVRDLVGAAKVGVFRDAPLEHILTIRDRLALDRIQLHGNEPDDFLDVLGPSTIRAVRPGKEVDWSALEELSRRCLPLLDPGGGDGVAWGWQEIGPPPRGLRFGVAGGLDPQNVADAVRTLGPYLVDVSSGVESSPGIKDATKIVDFIRNAREATRA